MALSVSEVLFEMNVGELDIGKKSMALAIIVAVVIITVGFVLVFTSDTNEQDSAYMDEYEYATHGSGNEGNEFRATLTSFKTDKGVASIQSRLEGYPLTTIASNSLNSSTLKEVIIPAGVSIVQDDAFFGCVNLEKVYFLGDRPSMGDVPDGVEIIGLQGKLGWDGYGMLELHEYTGEGYSIGLIEIDGKAIVNSLIFGERVRIPSEVNVNGGEVPVRSIGDEAFARTGVVSIEMADCIESIGVAAFYRCSQLAAANIPAKISIIHDEAFRECTVLRNVDLQNVRHIGFEAFRMCYGFTKVTIPDSTTFIGNGSFRVCSNVRELVIGSQITDIPEWCFDYYYALEVLECRGGIKTIGNYAFNNGSHVMVSLSFPHVEVIGNNAFGMWKSLERIDLGGKLREIGSNTFVECRALVSIELSESLEKMGNMVFYECRSLTDIKFNGMMPTIGEDAMYGSTATIYVLERHAQSWNAYSGDVVVI